MARSSPTDPTVRTPSAVGLQPGDHVRGDLVTVCLVEDLVAGALVERGRHVGDPSLAVAIPEQLHERPAAGQRVVGARDQRQRQVGPDGCEEFGVGELGCDPEERRDRVVGQVEARERVGDVAVDLGLVAREPLVAGAVLDPALNASRPAGPASEAVAAAAIPCASTSSAVEPDSTNPAYRSECCWMTAWAAKEPIEWPTRKTGGAVGAVHELLPVGSDVRDQAGEAGRPEVADPAAEVTLRPWPRWSVAWTR